MAGDRQGWLADLSRQFKRHRQGRPGWHLRVKRDRLRLLSDELPPRSDEVQAGQAGQIQTAGQIQRELGLNTPPGPATSAAALAEVCAVFDAVMAGTWRWPDPLLPAAHEAGRLAPATLAQLRSRFSAQLIGERITSRTWDRTYQPYLIKLEQIAAQQIWLDDAQLLSAALRQWPPNSRARQMAHDRMRALWKASQWFWPDELAAMRGNGKAAADPAGVMAFQDQEIEELRERISRSRLTASDLVAWDCLIVFGLRPAELKGLQLHQVSLTGGNPGGVSQSLVAVVAHEKQNGQGKVGARTIPAIPPATWHSDCNALFERWNEHGLPSRLVALPSPGEAMAHQLGRLHNQKAAQGQLRADLTPYGLRHAFALRLGIDLGLSVRESAELMGHSPAVHLAAYGRQLDKPKLLEKVTNMLWNS